MTDDMNVRGRAGAILSGRKLQMLEAEGIAVVEKQRLDALELLYRSCSEGVLALELMESARSPELKAMHDGQASEAESRALQALSQLEAMGE